MRIKIVDVFFEAVHYTGFNDKYNYLHGHTYRLEVEYRDSLGSLDYLLDFEELNSIVTQIASQWNYKLLVPETDVDKIKITGPFKTEMKVVKGKYATAEVMCVQILGEIREKLGNRSGELSLTIWEGPRYSASCSEHDK
ncbi:MAG: 6-carboxytetrahydropterin synthase [Thermocladium sp.]|jgi:6-pyruvoyltetrahydropterin/6-carboxytetrahydropterin synthase|nr:MAG: hypothetical protein AT710_01905 [Thermocladium sp. ECH_B]